MKLFLYFSQVLGMDVIGAGGEEAGVLHDLVMNPQAEIYPRATEIILHSSGLPRQFARVRWEDVAYIEEEVRLKVPASRLEFQKGPVKCDFSLRRDILDQQVVDTDDQRVVRVNDIHLLRVENQLYVAHVDVGLRALVRRMGWDFPVDTAVRLVNSRASYLTTEQLISWKNTQPLPKLGRMKSVLKLDVKGNKLSAIPPAALADIMRDLDVYARASVFKSLNAALQQQVFTDMTLTHKAELIEKMDKAEAAALLTNIPADEATDLLMRLPKEESHRFMSLLGTETNKKLRKLLSFAKDSAGGLMTVEYLSVPPAATVADGLKKIKENTDFPGGIFFLFMVDSSQKYLGTTSLRRFINEPPDKLLVDTCYPESIFVYTDDSVEEVALLLERHKASAIPVLDKQGVMQGVITIDDVMEELISLVWHKYKEKL